MANQHIIELNGKRYDAVTGKMVTEKPDDTPAHTPKSAADTYHRNVDGFARPVKPLVPHKTQAAKTLSRKSVSPPKAAKTITSKTTKQSTGEGPQHPLVAPKKVVSSAHVPKSSMVKRFNEVVSTKAPAFASSDSQHLKAISTPMHGAVASAASTGHNPLAAGLFNAKSHEEEAVKPLRRHARIANRLRVSPRVISTGAFVMAGLVLGGFFAIQNLAGLSMRVASARAGVKGNIPDYQPAGFTLGKSISYKPGEISLKYKSNSDNRHFQIVQATSNWNSATLLENYVASNHPNYQTVTPKGKTVYLYDNNATWVDSGIWYRVEGDSKLNSDQLQNIANGL